MKIWKLNRNEISKWYRECLTKDFPENEVKPLANIISLCEEGRYDVYMYEDEEGVYGYATIWKRPDYTTFLLDYLGVPEKRRNCGAGKYILADIRGRICEDEGRDNIVMILESETPETDNVSELKNRRLNFYKRNGFVKIYEMGTCGVRFTTLSYMVPPEDMELTMREHRMIYGPEREDIVIPLAKGEIPPLPYWMK